jgi:hypothetical protein
MAPAPAAPQPANPNSFYNAAGQQWMGTMSFAPGTSGAYREWANQNAANRAGYVQPGGTGAGFAPPAGIFGAEAANARTLIDNQRQQDSWNQQVGDIMRRFPGITPQQAADAAQQDRARSERAGREAWIDQYGTQAQRNDLAGTRGNRQYEEGLRNQIADQRRRDQELMSNPQYEEGLRNQIADQRRRDQELMSNPQSWGGSIPKWDGNKWTLPASSPGMAQPIQPQSQGTPYQPHVLYPPTGQNMGGGGYGQPPAQSGPPARTYDWAKGGVQPMGGGGMKPPASLPQPRPYDVISGGLQPIGPRPAPQAGGFAAPNNVTMKAYR